MSIHIGARDARNTFSDLMGKVYYSGETVIVERSGKPMVAMIPVDMFEQLIMEREVRFQILDRIRQRLPDVAEDEVQQDVIEAIAAIRKRAAKAN